MGLPLETLHPLRVLRERLGEDLDGHFALQLRIVRAIHLTHPAHAQGAQDFIGAETSAGGEGHARSDHRLVAGAICSSCARKLKMSVT